MSTEPATYEHGQLAEISWALNEACASHGHREMAEWRPVVGGKRPGWWLTKSGMSIPDHAASDVVLMKTVPEDFGSDTLTDLERAREIAVELERQNEALIEFIRPIAGRGCLYRKSGGCEDCTSCHALQLLKDCSAVFRP